MLMKVVWFLLVVKNMQMTYLVLTHGQNKENSYVLNQGFFKDFRLYCQTYIAEQLVIVVLVKVYSSARL